MRNRQCVTAMYHASRAVTLLLPVWYHHHQFRA